jgi:hypothetical protein
MLSDGARERESSATARSCFSPATEAVLVPTRSRAQTRIQPTGRDVGYGDGACCVDPAGLLCDLRYDGSLQ